MLRELLSALTRDPDTFVLAVLTAILILALSAVALRALGRVFIRRYGRTWRDVYRALRIRTNRFKLTAKARITEDLMRDREVLDAMMDHARETGASLTETEAKVRAYLDEIIPAFDLVSYYRVGLPIARAALGALYKLVSWKDEIGDAKKLHEESAVVYIFNHRSNADFVFAAFALTDRVALSYAVGEWARVWPLEGLFKSFGSYFVRRGYKEKLYHRVLGRYVQTITIRNVPQGIFLEGGLSRDGLFREAKVGLLDSILQVLKEPGFTKDIVFVPGCLNYDRVLEDRALTAEARGRKQPERKLFKALRRTARILFRGSLKLAFRRTRKHGYAALRLGKPISFRAWVAEHGREVLDLPREARQPHVKRFADHAMAQVAALMPVMHVPLISLAIGEDGSIGRDELIARVGRLRREIEAGGGRLVRPDKSDAEVADYAVLLLETRGTLAREGGRLVIKEPDREVFRYYANSLRHFVALKPAAGADILAEPSCPPESSSSQEKSPAIITARPSSAP